MFSRQLERLRLHAEGAVPAAAARLRQIGSGSEVAPVAWTALSLVLMISILTYAADDFLAFVAAALIWLVGTVLGFWNFLGCAKRITDEFRDSLEVEALAKQQRPNLRVRQIASPTMQLTSLQQDFANRFGEDPLREREAVAVARDIYLEARHRRFANPAIAVDQVEAARPELMRVLRLVQVQALRAGILCTFIGLLIGLHNFGIGSSPGQQHVAELMGGLRRGFGASIAGLLVAVWAGFLAQQLASRQAALRVGLHRMASEVVELLSRASQDDEFFREVPQVTEAMRLLRAEIGQALYDTKTELSLATAAFADTPKHWENLGELVKQHGDSVTKAQSDTSAALAREAEALEKLTLRAETALSQMVTAFEAQANAIRNIGRALNDEMRAAYDADTVDRIQREAILRSQDQIAALITHAGRLEDEFRRLRLSAAIGALLLKMVLAAMVFFDFGLLIGILLAWIST